MIKNRRMGGLALLRVVVGAGLAALLTSCGGAELSAPEPLESVASAVSVSPEYQDPTGSIHVRVRTCDTTPSATVNCAFCPADPAWVRVGGGGEIIGESNPGAVLQASFPSNLNFTTLDSPGCFGPRPNRRGINNVDDQAWVVRSAGAAHQLRAYVIEMQLSAGPNGARVRPFVRGPQDTVVDSVDPPASYGIDYPEAFYNANPAEPANWILVGGGAQVFSSVGDLFPDVVSDGSLTESNAIDGTEGRAWRGTARSQHSGMAEHLKVWTLATERCPAVLAPECLSSMILANLIAPATSGYGTAAHTVGSPYAFTTIGGVASTSGSNPRYLADLIPFNGTNRGFTVRSKAGSAAASGATTGTALTLVSSAALSNTLRPSSNLSALFRPSGTTPKLQQSTLFPDAPALHWYLEVLGNGVYRLRNGNPGASAVIGTECAYRDGSTNDVRVKTCGTGNEFKWRMLTPNLFNFQLVNVGANKCLDTNNQGFVTGNLVLKSCVSEAPTQIFFRDNFGWPPVP